MKAWMHARRSMAAMGGDYDGHLSSHAFIDRTKDAYAQTTHRYLLHSSDFGVLCLASARPHGPDAVELMRHHLSDDLGETDVPMERWLRTARPELLPSVRPGRLSGMAPYDRAESIALRLGLPSPDIALGVCRFLAIPDFIAPAADARIRTAALRNSFGIGLVEACLGTTIDFTADGAIRDDRRPRDRGGGRHGRVRRSSILFRDGADHSDAAVDGRKRRTDMSDAYHSEADGRNWETPANPRDFAAMLARFESITENAGGPVMVATSPAWFDDVGFADADHVAIGERSVGFGDWFSLREMRTSASDAAEIGQAFADAAPSDRALAEELLAALRPGGWMDRSAIEAFLHPLDNEEVVALCRVPGLPVMLCVAHSNGDTDVVYWMDGNPTLRMVGNSGAADDVLARRIPVHPAGIAAPSPR